MRKIFGMLVVSMLLVIPAFAAGQTTRPVALTWTASTSAAVTGYNVYSCNVASGATSCTPSVTGTPLATVTVPTFTINEPTGAAYGFSVVVVAPACTPTTPLTTACGNSGPTTVSYVPVPPVPATGSNIVVVVP